MIKQLLIMISSLFFRIITFIILLIPILLISLLIFLIDLQNPFFAQKRVGKNSKIFYIFKFRTMKKDIPTKLGLFLRRYKIDELLQVINLLNYTMNYVGPRPLTILEQEKGNKMIPDFKLRLNVKSGITGLQQVTKSNPSYEERLQLDLLTIKNKNNIYFMIKIIVKTIIPIKRNK